MLDHIRDIELDTSGFFHPTERGRRTVIPFVDGRGKERFKIDPAYFSPRDAAILLASMALSVLGLAAMGQYIESRWSPNDRPVISGKPNPYYPPKENQINTPTVNWTETK